MVVGAAVVVVVGAAVVVVVGAAVVVVVDVVVVEVVVVDVVVVVVDVVVVDVFVVGAAVVVVVVVGQHSSTLNIPSGQPLGYPAYVPFTGGHRASTVGHVSPTSTFSESPPS